MSKRFVEAFLYKKAKKTRNFGIKFAYVEKKQYLCTLKCAYCKCAHAILSAPREGGDNKSGK